MLPTSSKLEYSDVLFFCFFRSLGGSLRALMMRDAALGTTSTLACLFWIVSLTVTFSPFHSCVALAISSPTFLGDYRETMESISSLLVSLECITILDSQFYYFTTTKSAMTTRHTQIWLVDRTSSWITNTSMTNSTQVCNCKRKKRLWVWHM